MSLLFIFFNYIITDFRYVEAARELEPLYTVVMTDPQFSLMDFLAKQQIKSLGFSYDWDRCVSTCEPEYYKWTQWIFLQLYKKGLAYEAETPINWCPSCLTGLANEEVKEGKCERCGAVVTHKTIRQWILKITEYAERLLEDLDTLDSFDELKADDVEIYDYSQVLEALSECSGAEGGSVIFVDPSTLNHHVSAHLKSVFAEDCIRYGKSPVILQKAIKVESEIENLRQTHIDDGVAMTRFLYWLENEVASGREVTEWEASEMLTSLRAETPGYKGNSFENISAYGAGAALPHYSTPKEGSAVIQPRGLYLVDSGGQYLTGTTDITRTIPMGECTYLEKEDYTLVLKGMIDLSMAVFPHGTTGHQLDAFARMPLWRAHRNFGHGTGHGVGFYLCVHEGPQSIRFQPNPQPLLPGMLTSNEPAIYREGMHGVRHENIVLCKEAGESEFGRWLEFETLTICHIDTSAVLPELLGPEALAWLNEYNKRVYETLSEHLAPEIAQWLYAKCNS